MALQKKYYYSFKDIKNSTYTVEIWQETESTISAEEISGSYEAFSIEYPSSELFEPVKGSGCDLNLLSTTDRKFFDLYTADMMEYQIRFYNESVLIWCGYLDSELYSEPFNENRNYTVSFTGTDGFALLERINYLDESGDKYTSLLTQWDTIQNIINKLNLPYKNIYVGLSTTNEDITIGTDETILHHTYCNNQNWYNEDGDPETARKVLESILQPYGAFIIQDKANLYITDVNTIAGATTTSFKKYTSDFVYVSTDTVNLNLGDLSNIKFKSNSQTMTVVSGYNQQIIRYSPYIDADLLDYKADDFSDVVSTTTYGSSPYRWDETIYSTSGSWEAFNNGRFADYVGSDGGNTTEEDSYFKIIRYNTNGVSSSSLSFKLTKELPYIIPSDAKIKVAMKAYFRTVTDLNGLEKTSDLYQGKLRCKLKIGDRQYIRHSTINYPTYAINSGWRDITETTNSFDLDFETRAIEEYSNTKVSGFSAIDNNWITLKKWGTNGGYGDSLELREFDYLVPLNESPTAGITGGMLEFEIYDFDIMVNPTASTTPNYTAIKESVIDVRIKDISISVVNADGTELDNDDVEYVGYMNAKYKNEGDQITTLQGTSKTDNSIEKAALIGSNSTSGSYFYLKDWTREGNTDCIENLLLRSTVSNFTNKRIELTASINRLDSILGCITYQEYLSNKNLFVTGIIQNFADASSEVVLQEVKKDSLEINSSF